MPKNSSRKKVELKKESEMLAFSVSGLTKKEVDKMIKTITSETNIQIKYFSSCNKEEIKSIIKEK